MRTKNIFTPIVAVGLAMSLSVGSDLDITIGTTPIENFIAMGFPDGVSMPDIYTYQNQNGQQTYIDFFNISFDNNPISNQLRIDSQDGGVNSNLLLGNTTNLNFNGGSAWINSFTINLSRSNYSTSKNLTFSFVSCGDSEAFSGRGQKGVFNILNSQNVDDLLVLNFSGKVWTDFFINSKNKNIFSFERSERALPEVTGDITINGSDSKNIFNFEDITYRGTFTNAISTDTQINLNNSNTQFIGDINTTGGTTTINFLTSGATFQGNITANGGNNIVNFSSGDFCLSAMSSSGYSTYTTITATNNSTNTLNINGSIRIMDRNYTGSLTFEGNGNANGDNIVNISDDKSIESYLYINSGQTNINFLGSSGSIGGNIYLNRSASMTFSFDHNGIFTLPYDLSIREDFGWEGYTPYYGFYFEIDKNITFNTDLRGGQHGMNGYGNQSGIVFNIEDQASLSFFDGQETKTFSIIQGTNKMIFKGRSGAFRGNIDSSSSMGGIEITFEQDGSFEFDGIVRGRETYYNSNPNYNYKTGNYFIINKNITLTSQLMFDGSMNANSNIFLISDQKSLSFSNTDDSAYLKTIGGNTQIIFEGSSGGLGGNLIAEDGNNEFTFENAGTFSFSTANLIANNDSQI